MKKILATLATASTIVAGSALIAPSAEAVTITLEETDYKIGIVDNVEGEVNGGFLEEQPWFGSNVLAKMAAEQEMGDLGGAFFAYTSSPEQFFFNGVPVPGVNFIRGYSWNGDFAEDGVLLVNSDGISGAATYTIVTEVVEEVPEPLTLLGTMTFAGFITGMKKRRNEQK